MTTSNEESAYLATLRPSRIREIQAGSTAWTSVDLIDVEDGDAAVMRDALEAFGLRVNRFRVSQARHLVRALSTEATADYVVLACHGDEGRILVPDLAPEIERFQPFHDGLGPEEIRRFVRLAGRVVIATGCDTGRDELAQAFFDAGTAAYVAPAGRSVRLRQPVRPAAALLRAHPGAVARRWIACARTTASWRCGDCFDHRLARCSDDLGNRRGGLDSDAWRAEWAIYDLRIKARARGERR